MKTIKFKTGDMLFMNLMKLMPEKAWRANNHSDGTMFDGYFIAGIELETGQITYHLLSDYWTHLDYAGIRTSNKAPQSDGHTPKDVVQRLENNLLKNHT